MKYRTFTSQGQTHNLVRNGRIVTAYEGAGGTQPYRTVYSHTFATVSEAKAFFASPRLSVN